MKPGAPNRAARAPCYPTGNSERKRNLLGASASPWATRRWGAGWASISKCTPGWWPQVGVEGDEQYARIERREVLFETSKKHLWELGISPMATAE